MYSITKSFKFEAAHRLLSMPENHPCRNLHGHSYVVKVSISVENISILENPNMLIDFGKLKEFQKWLDENFDHATILNNTDSLFSILKEANIRVRTMPSGDPTAENMASFFCAIIGDLCRKFNLQQKYTVNVEVFETVGNSASFQAVFE
jgi:queuosine biosynthesis protein QueD